MILPITPRGFATPTLRSGNVSFTVEFQLFEDVDFGVAGASWVPDAGLIVLPWDTCAPARIPRRR